MAATVKHCEAEIDRLQKALPLPFGVDRGVLAEELVKALARHSRDASHASQIVRHVLATMTACPTPAELTALARDLEPAVEGDTLPEGCAKCHGQPHVSIWVCRGCDRRNSADQERCVCGGRQTNAVWAAARCGCARGQFLAAKDRERAEKARKIA